MKIVIIILILAAAALAILFVAGAIKTNVAEDDLYREFDDRDQADYLRRWREEKNRKKHS